MRRSGTDGGTDRPRTARRGRREDGDWYGQDEDTAAETERPRGTKPAARRQDRAASVTAAGAAGRAARCIREMTGKEPDQITALERTGDGRWRVDVQVVETRRIPDSTDILAIYQAELDADGELVSYRRTQRFARCQVQGGK
jgi:gas vesicle protein GvpO